MLRQYDRNLRTLLLLTDISLSGASFVACHLVLGGGEFGPLLRLDTLALGLLAALALPVIHRAIAGSSARLERIEIVAIRLLAAGGLAMVTLAAAAYLVGAVVTPRVLVACVGLQVAAVGALRLSLLAGLRFLRSQGRNYRNVVIIGTGPLARDISDTLERHREWGLRIVGYVDEGDSPLDPEIPAEKVYKMVDFPRLLYGQVVDEVIAAYPRTMLGSIGPVVEVCSATGVPLAVMTDLFGDYLPPPRLKRFASHAALSFRPVHHSRAQLGLKRVFDLAGALIGLLVGAPALALAALLIRLDSPGPILFRQLRSGLYGRPFMMYKLRTMVVDAEDHRHELAHLNEMQGPVFKIRSDPRVTRIGRLLRRFSIDELPQLWNVLKGDMSIVGPRPPLPEEVVQYEPAERRRLSMRPGLTCLWQVMGRNELHFQDWVKLDLQYIDDWSLLSDLRILALTLPAVLRGTGT